MVDRDVVFDRLASLRMNARRLKAALARGRERFVEDEDVYLEVDHGRMFDDLTAGLGDFEGFARAIEAFVSSRP